MTEKQKDFFARGLVISVLALLLAALFGWVYYVDNLPYLSIRFKITTPEKTYICKGYEVTEAGKPIANGGGGLFGGGAAIAINNNQKKPIYNIKIFDERYWPHKLIGEFNTKQYEVESFYVKMKNGIEINEKADTKSN